MMAMVLVEKMLLNHNKVFDDREEQRVTYWPEEQIFKF